MLAILEAEIAREAREGLDAIITTGDRARETRRPDAPRAGGAAAHEPFQALARDECRAGLEQEQARQPRGAGPVERGFAGHHAGADRGSRWAAGTAGQRPDLVAPDTRVGK